MKRVILLCITTVSVYSNDLISGMVFRVSDGDTITIKNDINEDYTKCRLYGIDAPEKSQPYGPEAKRFLSQMVLGRDIQYRVVSKDVYGRAVCIVITTDEVPNLEINEHMVRSGLAWAYVQYLKKDKETLKRYSTLQEEAMKSRIGLWQDPNPQPPWEYRKRVKIKDENND
jgi:endonuclease YncB( thermonuclease family)